MAKRKSRQRKVSRRINNKRINDISNNALMIMVIVVLVISMISVGLYMYAFYNDGSVQFQKSSVVKEIRIIKDSGAVSGMATMQIIKPSEEKVVQ